MNLQNNIHVIIPAAGIGSRMQSETPKQYLQLADMRVIEHSLKLFCSLPYIKSVHVGLRTDDTVFATLPTAKHPKIKTFLGGAERSETVLNGLASLADSDVWVMVHDAARPGLSKELVDQLVETATLSSKGAIIALPVADTLKKLAGSGVSTIDRKGMWQAQTPQMFNSEQLRSSLEKACADGYQVTDEASAIEYTGGELSLVEGSPLNMKLTSPADYSLLSKLLG